MTSSTTGICVNGPPSSHSATVVLFARSCVSSVRGIVVVGPLTTVLSTEASDSSMLSVAPKPPHPSSIAGSFSRRPLGKILCPTTTEASCKNVVNGVRLFVIAISLDSVFVSDSVLSSPPGLAMCSPPLTETVEQTLRGHNAETTSCASIDKWPFIRVNRFFG